MGGLVYSSVLGWLLGIALGAFAGTGLYKEIMGNHRSNKLIARIASLLTGLAFFVFGFIFGQVPDYKERIQAEENKNLSFLEVNIKNTMTAFKNSSLHRQH